ncbi:hypothetical protein, partial [Bacillus pumilus]|uniref:hypothetical protein n=1 Tax=Bacillus pumilus TaxID=1408 RepID=UPI001C92F412
ISKITSTTKFQNITLLHLSIHHISFINKINTSLKTIHYTPSLSSSTLKTQHIINPHPSDQPTLGGT